MARMTHDRAWRRMTNDERTCPPRGRVICHGAPAPVIRHAGFTLIEVLVALALMALMAVMAWRGIDGMARAQQIARQHADAVLALQAGLAQWRADLDAMRVWPEPASPVPPGGQRTTADLARRSLAWDGRTLRITRTDSVDVAAGLRVVAWARTGDGQWTRWQSAPLRSTDAWTAAWEQAALWGQGAVAGAQAQAVGIAAISDWQLQYFRNNAWTSPLSSGAESASVQNRLPLAIRLRIELAPGQAISGPLTLDWLQPAFRPGAS